MGKTIRFGDLVRQSGRPHVATLWVDPEKDPSFSKAIAENRVLTVHSEPASHKKEFGEIGFQREQGATYLVFPQPLSKEQEQARIVGINYELTEEPPPPPEDLVSQFEVKPRKKEKAEAKPPKVKPAKPVLRSFDVVVRRTAILEETEHVKAVNEEEAREASLATMKGKPFNVHRATVGVEILSVTEKAV